LAARQSQALARGDLARIVQSDDSPVVLTEHGFARWLEPGAWPMGLMRRRGRRHWGRVLAESPDASFKEIKSAPGPAAASRRSE
jgi:hypothetical protein